MMTSFKYYTKEKMDIKNESDLLMMNRLLEKILKKFLETISVKSRMMHNIIER